MEKISHIVRGNARTASVDMKGSQAVRPGAPAFGRPMGESPQVAERGETTAAKVANLRNEMEEQKKTGDKDHVVQEMADAFFMTRVRRPDEEVTMPVPTKGKVSVRAAELAAPEEWVASELHEGEIQPSGFTPRGSYVDVRA